MIADEDKERLWFDDENDVTLAIHADGVECLEILTKVVLEVPFRVWPRNIEL
jgi:hypothetical protein